MAQLPLQRGGTPCQKIMFTVSFFFPGSHNPSKCLMSGSLPSPEALIPTKKEGVCVLWRVNIEHHCKPLGFSLILTNFGKHQRFSFLYPSLPRLEVRIYTPATSVPTPGLATGPVPIFVALKQQYPVGMESFIGCIGWYVESGNFSI